MSIEHLDRSKKMLASVAVLLATSSASLAQDAQQPDSLATRSGWEVGAQAAHYHYEEPGAMKLIGSRVGRLGSFTFTRAGLFFRTDVRLSYGELKYQSEGSGTKDRVPDAIFEPRFLVGKDFPSDNGMVFSPYAGLGFRTLYNDLRGNTKGRSTPANPSGIYAGYRRYSYYLYAPVGLSTRVGLDNRWVLAPMVEYDFFLRGTQISTLSDVGGCNRDISNTQKRGYGYRAAFMVEKSRWAFGPWIHRWSIENSDLQQDACGGPPLLEPRNWTREIGFEIRYRF
jgi:opacity protein-like surface antigen